MKRVIFLLAASIILMAGCQNSKKLSYDTLYQVPVTVQNSEGPLDITVETDGYTLKITESKENQKPQDGVSGTDGTNFYHEVYGTTLSKLITDLSLGMGRVKMINAPDLPPMDVYYRSTNRIRGEFNYTDEFHIVLMPLLSELFDFKMTREDLPTTTYVVEITDAAKARNGAENIDTSKYMPASGLLYSDRTNVNEEDGVYYGTVENFIDYMNVYGQFADLAFTTGETNDEVYALPLSFFESPSKELLFDKLDTWGFSVREELTPKETFVFDFGEL